MQPLSGVDRFIEVLDYDQRISGLPGNISQLKLYLQGIPKRDSLENLLKKNFERLILSRTYLKSSFVRRGWEVDSKNAVLKISWFEVSNSLDILHDGISAIEVSEPPLFNFRILKFSQENQSIISFTWHHLLADAKGGEYLLGCLLGNNEVKEEPIYKIFRSSFREKLKGVREFRRIVRRMAQAELKTISNGCSFHVKKNS